MDALAEVGNGTDPDFPAALQIDLTRSLRQLSSGFRWAAPLQQATFETCAGIALNGCLSLTPPIGKGFDPGLKNILLGAALGYAAAKGGTVYLLGAAALFLLKKPGQGLV